MEVRNVVLIGFMGAGKTEVGRALASRLRYEFIDTDEVIVEAAGRSIADIFAAEGEEGFRAREADAVRRACSGFGRVIACGGGAVLRLRNYQQLKAAGPIVYLRATPGTLRARVGDGADRPMLDSPGAFDRLLAERIPVYEAAADVTVDAESGSPEQLASAIERLLA